MALVIAPRRHLTVVEPVSRGVAGAVALFVAGLFVIVTLVVAFHATIAAQQLKIDKVTAELRAARTYHDELRQARAALIAPDVLRVRAVAEEMVPGRTGRFVPVPQDVAVAVAVVSGSMDDDVALPRPEDPLKPDDAIRG
jgi:hypothetical protein